MSCLHQVVVPVLPFHLDGWRSEVTGTCALCGAFDFVVWEAYSFGDAAHGDPLPSDAEVLAEFEPFWVSLALYGETYFVNGAVSVLPPDEATP